MKSCLLRPTNVTSNSAYADGEANFTLTHLKCWMLSPCNDLLMVDYVSELSFPLKASWLKYDMQ